MWYQLLSSNQEMKLRQMNTLKSHKETDTYWFLRFHRVIDYRQRQRSLSDSTDLNSPGAFTAESTAEKVRKTQSYTAFPHINKNSTCLDDEPSFNFYRTSCFRIMPQCPFTMNIFQQSPILSRSSFEYCFGNQWRIWRFRKGAGD